MNHSLEEEGMQEQVPKGHGFLEDQEAGNNGNFYEYDYDQYGANGLNDHSEYGNSAGNDPLNKLSKRFAEDDMNGDSPFANKTVDSQADNDDFINVTPRQAIRYTTEPEPEIGILFFCMWESRPKDFLSFVLSSKVADLLIFLLVFGFIAIYIQAIFSLVFYLVRQRLMAGKSSHMMIKSLFYLMVIQNLFISVIFMINLIRSSNNSQPLYIIYLVLVYFIWITQNIAWDFQLIENSGLFLDIPETNSQGMIGNESTQIKDKQFPTSQVSGKTKLKRRTPSSLNNSGIGV